ncbi:Uma2 family endonuclease [Rivularia sp. UHCC 0363]|uniref:Uma2 family endonuclease n=1 Tax=Rivularia sp. UHCC 0363 TaxID=3110244 RepID=UPI002B21428B|nr:Uma2 family endonuclease [Rivularia sp. UHCC 0363]MEA5596114.1 Uma2 family endonuclease [Rivularia sp. UHCC 0363]
MYQTDPPIPAKESLPTMYDLPSEDLQEPGLPDEFHIYQPQLLEETFRPPTYSTDEIFVATDLNLYYDSRNTLWYKRPDWFAVVGTSRFYEQRDLRLSYVVWQEGINPFVVVELLSPGTEKEDLGQIRIVKAEQPPTKWQVYERILRVPYYIVFDRYTDTLRAFILQADSYTELNLEEPRIWMPSLEMGLGLWQGNYKGIERLWLRWYDDKGDWIPTPLEQERQRAERLAAKLRELNINPDEL